MRECEEDPGMGVQERTATWHEISVSMERIPKYHLPGCYLFYYLLYIRFGIKPWSVEINHFPLEI